MDSKKQILFKKAYEIKSKTKNKWLDVVYETFKYVF